MLDAIGRRRVVVTIGLTLALVLGGCGSDDSSDEQAPSSTAPLTSAPEVGGGSSNGGPSPTASPGCAGQGGDSDGSCPGDGGAEPRSPTSIDPGPGGGTATP
jgi:hypothetical protein